jgi:antitoxin ParD1/3/4
MAEMLAGKVQSGEFGSVSEVIRAALRTMMEKERMLENLDRSIARGLAGAEAGRVSSSAEARMELAERLEKTTPARSKRYAVHMDTKEAIANQTSVSKCDPYFEQLKADVLEGAAAADRGELFTIEEARARTLGTIARIQRDEF